MHFTDSAVQLIEQVADSRQLLIGGPQSQFLLKFYAFSEMKGGL
jgi:hypothetical protein